RHVAGPRLPGKRLAGRRGARDGRPAVARSDRFRPPDAAHATGNRRGHRSQGRSRQARMPGRERLLADNHAGVALSPLDGKRAPAPTRHRSGLFEPDHVPTRGRRSPSCRPRRAPRRRLGPTRGSQLRGWRARRDDCTARRLARHRGAALANTHPRGSRQHDRGSLPPRGQGTHSPTRQAPSSRGCQHADAHPAIGQSQAGRAPEPASLADQARSSEPRAGAPADRLHAGRRHHHSRYGLSHAPPDAALHGNAALRRSRTPSHHPLRRPLAVPLATLVVLLAAIALLLAIGLPGPAGTPRAAGQTGGGEVTAQTDDAVPARGVVMIGASPSEAPNETWGIGEVGALNGGSWGIVRYADGAGWSRAPWLDSSAQPPSESVLKPDSSPLAGRITPGGAGALLATVSREGQPGREVLLVRAPGRDFQETAPVPDEGEGEGALMKPGESLFSRTRAPLIAALDEGGGRAGALVVPVNGGESGVEEDGVLHWDGDGWTREQIEVPVESEEHKDLRVLAIGASSPANAWLLAQLPQQTEPGGVALFRRPPNP